MVRAFIEVPAFDTGKTGIGIVRTSLAFDMRGISPGQPVAAAVLELPASVATRSSSVRLLEPTTGSTYAVGTATRGTIALTARALRDVRGASGAFFYCDAVLEDESGASVALPPALGGCVLRIEHCQAAAAEHCDAIAA